jgi:arylformamidase
MRLIDVSHPLHGGMTTVPGLPRVSVEPWTEMAAGDPFDTSKVIMSSHAGTHVDAPAHAIPGGRTIDELELERFCGPAVVVAVSRGVGEEITVQDILDSGPPPEAGDMLLLSTGWDSRFFHPEYHQHPSLDPAVAEWAVELGLSIVGTDTLSPDRPVNRARKDSDFPVHKILLGEEVLIIENLRGLASAVDRRVLAYAFPVLVRGGDAGAVRVVLDLDVPPRDKMQDDRNETLEVPDRGSAHE